MEPVAKLFVDVGLSSDHKGEILPAPIKKNKPQEGFSQVLTRQLSDHKKSGKEATQKGKKSTQLLNKSDHKQEKTAKKTDAVSIEDKNIEEVSGDKKNHVTGKKMPEQSLKSKQKKSTQHDDAINQPEQLISLLQSSDQTLTKPEKIVLQSGLTAQQTKSKKKFDLSVSLKGDKKGDETLLADKKSANKLKVLTATGDDTKSKSYDVKTALTPQQLKMRQTAGKTSLAEVNIDKTADKHARSTEAQILTDLNKQKNQQKTTSTITTGSTIDLKQLTEDQLQKMALLRNAPDTNHKKGQTPPIIVKPPVLTSLQDETKLTTKKRTKLKIKDVVIPGKSTEIKDKKHETGQTPPIIVKPPVLTSLQDETMLTIKKNNKLKIKEEDSSNKNASMKDKNEADMLKSAVLIEKKAAPINTQLSATGSVEKSTTNSSDGIDNKLKDIQSLQAVSQKIVENNVQTQKVDLSNQIQTINMDRKDFVSTLQEKVMVMVQQKIHQVDIRLDPPELGHMHVRLNLHNEQANVQFVVQHQQAKDVLDQNMPRLKEMLAQQGVNVGDANVGHQNEQSSTSTTQGDVVYQKGDMSEEDYFEENSQVFSINSFKGSALGVDYYA